MPRNDTKTNTKTTWASDAFTFSNSKSCRTRCVLQNDTKTNTKSTHVNDSLRFPIQNRLEILVRSERCKNQYQIDPRERSVTFSNTKSSRNCCAPRTIQTIQKQMQNRLGRARRAISLRFSTQNRLDISVCPETIQKPIQKRPGRAIRLRFPIQNRVELAVCSKTIPKPLQNRPT